MASRTENIALFPLNIFLLPGDYTQLYIFEERYKQLINECEHDQVARFGIVFSSSANDQNFGTLVELRDVVRRYPGGEMDILVQAHSIFRLESFKFQQEGKLYPAGEILVLEDVINAPASWELQACFKEHQLKYNRLDAGLLSSDPLGIFDIANEVALSHFEKLELADLSSHSARDTYLINYLRYLEIIEEQETSVQDGIYLN